MRSSVNESVLRSIAKSLGLPYHRRHYRMWHSVPHIGDTALVVDCVIKGGGYGLASPEQFPRKIDAAYVENAVRHHAFSLGELDTRASAVFTPWENRVGKYPPGYFAHKVGEDVPSGM